ncbi:hypothetical protein EJ08DRAFT_105472 [Tothia fuscella]|uniref:Uncharacterized protein n=1 Tax=Tothia fuscella TaxID=1048955 RepID=A0A9P4TZZ5_9PEZI|nr:hypothetical protein EJ08DRAFT_105472 [Tothia fuscella]
MMSRTIHDFRIPDQRREASIRFEGYSKDIHTRPRNPQNPAGKLITIPKEPCRNCGEKVRTRKSRTAEQRQVSRADNENYGKRCSTDVEEIAVVDSDAALPRNFVYVK